MATTAARAGSDSDRYAAFLSYSHECDSAVAAATQRALHNFARPWYRLRALRVFRDESSLGATAELGASIERALLSSTYLILLASRAAAESPWVGREVAFWCEHKGVDRLLVVVTDGDVVWDEARGDFTWPATTAIPRVLAGAFKDEPRHVDLRWVRDDPSRMSLHDANFRICVADLAAPLHGVPKDLIIGEDVRAHTRAVRFVRTGVAGLLAVAVALALVTNSAMTQRAKATSARHRAVLSAREALSRQLAAESIAQPRSSLDTSLLLAVEAMQLGDSPVARHALTTALRRARGVAAVVRTDGAVSAVAYHSVTDRLAVIESHSVSAPDSVSVWDVATHRRLWTAPLAGALRAASFDIGGETVAALAADGVRFFDATTGDPRGALPISISTARATTVSADGGVLGVVRPAGQTSLGMDLWDLRKRVFVGRVPVGAAFDVEPALSRNGRFVAVRQGEGRVEVWRVGSRRPAHSFRTKPSVGVLAVDDAGALVGVVHSDATIEIWDALAGKRTASDHVDQSEGDVIALEFSPDRRAVALSSFGHTNLWEWAKPGSLPMRDWVKRRLAVFPRTVHVMEHATGGRDPSIYLFPRKENPINLTARPIWLVPAGPNRVLAAGDEATVLLDTTNGTVLNTYPAMRSLIGDAQGQTLAYYDPSTLWGADLVLSTNAGASATPVAGLSGRAGAFAMSADGSVLAVGVLVDARPNHVVIRDIPTGRDLAVLDGWDGGYPLLGGQVNHSVSVSGDGTAVAFSNGAGVTLWRRGEVKRIPAAPGVVTKVQLSHDAARLALNDGAGYIEILDTNSMTFQGRVLADHVSDIAFTPDGRTLATASGSDVSLWNLDTFEGRDVLPADGGATTIAFDSQGGMLLAGSMTGTVSAWDLVETRPNIMAACAIVARKLDSVETRQYFGRSEIRPSGCVGAR